MADYSQMLNRAGTQLVQTPAFYSTDLAEWLMGSANALKTAGGVWVFQRGDTSGQAQVVGAAADDAAAAGNPLLMAGKYNATPATRQEGDAVTLQTSATGSLRAELTGSNFEQTPGSVAPSKAVQIGGTDGTNLQRARVDGFNNLAVVIRNGVDQANMPDGSADGITTASRGVQVFSGGLGLNGATWDRWRNNTEVTLLANAARTASAITPFQTNYNAKGVQINLRVDAASGTGGLIANVWGRVDPNNTHSEKILLSSANILTLGNYAFQIYPGLDKANPPGTFTKVENGALPRTWYVHIVHGDGSSYTYSLGACTIL